MPQVNANVSVNYRIVSPVLFILKTKYRCWLWFSFSVHIKVFPRFTYTHINISNVWLKHEILLYMCVGPTSASFFSLTSIFNAMFLTKSHIKVMGVLHCDAMTAYVIWFIRILTHHQISSLFQSSSIHSKFFYNMLHYLLLLFLQLILSQPYLQPIKSDVTMYETEVQLMRLKLATCCLSLSQYSRTHQFFITSS